MGAVLCVISMQILLENKAELIQIAVSNKRLCLRHRIFWEPEEYAKMSQVSSSNQGFNTVVKFQAGKL